MQLAAYPLMTAIPRAKRIAYSVYTTSAWMLLNVRAKPQRAHIGVMPKASQFNKPLPASAIVIWLGRDCRG
jgi:hypothetical protein